MSNGVNQKSFNKFVYLYGTPVAILLGCLIISAAIWVSSGQKLPGLATFKGATGTQAPPVADPSGSGGVVNVSADDDPVIGDSKAPVTMIEFSDFQCPFCRALWRDTLPQIKAKYIDKGLVKFVYRDFPLNIHPEANIAAEAGECAHEQGKFWELHDKIFAEQDKQGAGTVRFTADDLKNWAKDLGLNSGQFNNCFDSGKYQSEIQKDMNDGIAAGVTGTPATYINGKLVKGALPYSNFEQLIEVALKSK